MSFFCLLSIVKSNGSVKFYNRKWNPPCTDRLQGGLGTELMEEGNRTYCFKYASLSHRTGYPLVIPGQKYVGLSRLVTTSIR